MDEVEEFIARRWSTSDANWQNGNCYWFAYILCERFPYLGIYYQPIIGHFVAGLRPFKAADNIKYYDASGAVKADPNFIPIWEIAEKDPLWFQRLMRDCKS